MGTRTRHAAASEMEGVSGPLGYFDPLGLADMVDDAGLAWFRHAELKHCRVAMAATTGFLVNAFGIHFEGNVDLHGTSFASLDDGGILNAWNALPQGGRDQILLTIGLIEFHSELSKPHVMKGAKPGKILL